MPELSKGRGTATHQIQGCSHHQVAAERRGGEPDGGEMLPSLSNRRLVGRALRYTASSYAFQQSLMASCPACGARKSSQRNSPPTRTACATLSGAAPALRQENGTCDHLDANTTTGNKLRTAAIGCSSHSIT
jgi:hypothetical protein